jgi:hypothetical protein
MADEVRLNVRYITQNARQAADPKRAIDELCKAVEQLDDQISDLAKRIDKSGK